ncbi:MFS transporter [Cytobacillus purgationiresistens]|uniref:MFS family permease n=1 Tax=Cytobacillus purgationiresistens TaxID=863449 RepID=A0ABU0AH57_9BACI|nr:MFS family permease [Cytobacillus purgationiresistens]
MSIIRLFREEKDYLKLFSAGILNGIGDRFSQVALLALLLNITGSGLAVGLALAIRVIPFLLFAPFGGALADRFSRRHILVFTDLSRILFALSFIFVNDSSTLWIVYVSSFFLAAGEAIYAPARKSAIPVLVKQENIVKVNSLEQVMLGVVLIGGSFSGGVVTHFFGPDLTFIINGLSFLFAAIFLSRLHALDQQEEFTAPELERTDARKSFQSFLTFHQTILASSALTIILLSEILIPLVNGIDNVLISIYAVQEFNLGDVGVGLFYGSLGIGLMLSFPFAERIQNHLLKIGLLALVLEGAALMFLSQTQSVTAAMLTFIVVSFFSGVGNTCFDSVLMKETPKAHRGFIFGILTTISNSLMGLSMFAAGVAAEIFPNRALGFAGGLGFVLTGMALFIVYLMINRGRGLAKY